MKFCIIALPRSRSSMLLEIMSLYYNIEILGEDIGKIKKRHGDEYIITLKRLLDKNADKLSGVMRLHPLQLVSIDPFTVLNFDWFKFEQYNNIIFTHRESIADSIASTFVAEKLNKFTYQNVNDIVQFKEPFYFCKTKDSYHIRDYVNSIKVMGLLKEYLDLHNIRYQNLYYNEIPKYTATKFPKTNTFHVETCYNYKEIISNYDDILKIYNQKTL
jgi:hypothetical protein